MFLIYGMAIVSNVVYCDEKGKLKQTNKQKNLYVSGCAETEKADG